MSRCWLCSTSSGGSVAGGHCGRCDCCRPLASPSNYARSDLAKKRRAAGNNRPARKNDGCAVTALALAGSIAAALAVTGYGIIEILRSMT